MATAELVSISVSGAAGRLAEEAERLVATGRTAHVSIAAGLGTRPVCRLVARGADVPSIRLDGGPGEPDAYALVCAAKPLLAMTVATLFAREGLSLDVPVNGVVGRTRCDNRVLVRHLLDHSNGFTDDAEPADGVLPSCGPPGEIASYTLRNAWRLLTEVAAAVGRRAPADSVRELVLDPLGLDIAFGVRPSGYLVNAGKREPQGPWIRLPQLAAVDSGVDMFAVGGVGTVAGLQHFYQALIAPPPVSDPLGAAARLMVQASRPPMHDEAFGRLDVSFGLGLALDLGGTFGVKGASPASFWHTGTIAACHVTLGWGDPAVGLSAAITLVGLSQRNMYYLQRLASALYEDVRAAAAAEGASA